LLLGGLLSVNIARINAKKKLTVSSRLHTGQIWRSSLVAQMMWSPCLGLAYLTFFWKLMNLPSVLSADNKINSLYRDLVAEAFTFTVCSRKQVSAWFNMSGKWLRRLTNNAGRHNVGSNIFLNPSINNSRVRVHGLPFLLAETVWRLKNLIVLPSASLRLEPSSIFKGHRASGPCPRAADQLANLSVRRTS
jgi:hypothetical protein